MKGKIAIVTGAAQGIGKAICKNLSNQGANVILNDINEEAVLEAVADLGPKVEGYVGDVGNIQTINELVNYAKEKYGKVDILVANAGLTLFGDFFEYTPEDFMKVVQVNLFGSFFLAQSTAKLMKELGGGSIVFMSSVTGNQAHRDLAAYSMSKAALQMLAKNLVIELSKYQINVNCVAPGAIVTERTSMDASYMDTWSQLTPMGRPGTVDDVANAVCFLVSDGAKQITGQTLIVDGGWSSISPNPE
jgi:glucose 1-dehydrogenase